MGLSNNTTEQLGTKLSIVGGRFTLRVAENTAGAEPRTLTKGKNEGKEVWEMRYLSLEDVVLVGGKIVESEYPGVDVMLRDNQTDEDVTINLPLESRYLFDFIRHLPNLDEHSPFNVEMHESKKKTKQGDTMYNLRLVQFGTILPDYYVNWSKDEDGKNVATPLHGIPEPKHGIKGWDFRDVEEFLLEQFREFFDTFSPNGLTKKSLASVTEDKEDNLDMGNDEGLEPLPF